MSQTNKWLLSGAILGGLAVALGAFGAHVLEDILSSSELSTYETAVRYQMYHALALLLLSLMPNTSKWVRYAGYSFLAGVLIFSGCLYLLVFTGLSWLGAITPIGGVLMIVGWGMLARAAFQRSSTSE